MQVVVTGATGKLGPHVVRAAGSRVEVTALVPDEDRARTGLGGRTSLVGSLADTGVIGAARGADDALGLLTRSRDRGGLRRSVPRPVRLTPQTRSER